MRTYRIKQSDCYTLAPLISGPRSRIMYDESTLPQAGFPQCKIYCTSTAATGPRRSGPTEPQQDKDAAFSEYTENCNGLPRRYTYKKMYKKRTAPAARPGRILRSLVRSVIFPRGHSSVKISFKMIIQVSQSLKKPVESIKL